MIDNRTIIRDGFWSNNVGLVQLLGLCPLLAVTGTFINGLGLGLATMVTLIASNVCVSAIRSLVRPEVRIPVFVLIIASIVTIIELLMSAFMYDLYLVLGIFIPLIVTNCSIIGRAEAFASRHTVSQSFLDGFSMGAGFLLVLVTLGSLREIIGHGTLFSHAHRMFGDLIPDVTIVFSEHYNGFLLAALPPGAFIGLGLLIALKNIIDKRAQTRAATSPAALPVAQTSS
ncbi:Electron transport complex protein RnfE [hydrothermal vent metagenome]|uniref:Electron transport complex protein RnfE n=1 Tax=hydrothermal vent metagenome TaxID=652676 RepID=A0A3B0YET9_9ZZZZ